MTVSSFQTLDNMQPWNVPHQKAGDPEPKVNPDKVTVYNMRYADET